mgnify:CR=1 FL=1
MCLSHGGCPESHRRPADRLLSPDPRSTTYAETQSAGSLAGSHRGSVRLENLEATSKPSWKNVVGRESENCPWWFAESLQADERHFWAEAVGAGFCDWYLEHREESAHVSRQVPARQPPEVQLSLPGLDPLSRAAPFTPFNGPAPIFATARSRSLRRPAALCTLSRTTTEFNARSMCVRPAPT